MIRVSGLTRVYGNTVGVEDLNFEIRDAEIFALLGPNGSGKTTTLRLMTGMISPTNGYVSVDDIRTDQLQRLPEIHRKIVILPEVPGHYENLSAYRNLQFFGRMYGMSDRAIESRTKDLMIEFELWDKRESAVATFSKGMKQKLAILRTVMHDPKYVFLDEPLSGLDPESSKFVRDYMKSLKENGKTVILSTHDLDDADKLSDRVAVVRNRLLAIDSPSALKAQVFKRTVVFHIENIQGLDLKEIGAMPFVNSVKISKDSIVMEVESPEKNNPDITAYLVGKGFRVQFIGEIRRSLEDVYLSIVEKSKEGKL